MPRTILQRVRRSMARYPRCKKFVCHRSTMRELDRYLEGQNRAPYFGSPAPLAVLYLDGKQLRIAESDWPRNRLLVWQDK